ncbi:MAG: DUF1778 domain-containing protein [Desulfuromonadales bacterium]|nr:DUF1778 domain-containing protein [Desulfuromonadales bacterium]
MTRPADKKYSDRIPTDVDERRITLSPKAAKTVFDVLEEPPPANERLKKAVHRAKETLSRK